MIGLILFLLLQQPKNHVFAPELTDKQKLEIVTEQLAEAKMIAEFQTWQKQIDEANKRMAELKTQYNDSATKLATLTKGICGDEKIWAFNGDTLKCEAVKK